MSSPSRSDLDVHVGLHLAGETYGGFFMQSRQVHASKTVTVILVQSHVIPTKRNVGSEQV